MNELQHTATATLPVLNRVQIGLERIRAGHGSEALLPTIADQLRDAVKIIEIGQSALAAPLDEPAFLDDGDPSDTLPARVSTTNARELFGLREGETVAEAMARCDTERPRKLTPVEVEDLRQDMQKSSEWMKAELARRKQDG